MTIIGSGLGFILGAISFAYIILHPSAIGFTFPNLSGEWAVRPTWYRLTIYLTGRWLGLTLMGIMLGWLGVCFSWNVIDRLAFAACVLFSIFILLFLATGNSPELIFAKQTNLLGKKSPLILLGFFSGATMIAPFFITALIALTSHDLYVSVMIFTNFFLGSTFISLPLLLNINWIRTNIYIFLLRLITFFCTSIVLILSIFNLLYS